MIDKCLIGGVNEGLIAFPLPRHAETHRWIEESQRFHLHDFNRGSAFEKALKRQQDYHEKGDWGASNQGSSEQVPLQVGLHVWLQICWGAQNQLQFLP